MASKRSKKIWENSVPLDEAWLFFAPPDRRAAYENLPKWSIDADQVPNDQNQSLWKALGAVAQSWIETSDAKRELQDSLQGDLLDRLFNADLIATAYRELPTTSPSPVEFGSDDFDEAEPDWQSGKIIVHGRTYGRVRIMDPCRLAELDLLKPRQGLAGSGAIIRKAMRDLRSAYPEFCSIPRKEAFEKIRNHLSTQRISAGGLSNQNLGKYIVEICPRRRTKPL